ncbi:MAG: EAL domain-containing protein [Pseudomonadota bacterium]
MQRALYSHLASEQGDSPEDSLRSNQHLSALIRFVTSAIDVVSVDELLWLLTGDVVADLGFEDCIIYLVDPTTGKLVQRAAYGPKNRGGHEVTDPIELDFDQGIVGRCARTQATILIDDLSSERDYVVDDAVRASELAVPILHEGHTVGVIDSEHSSVGFYTRQHIGTLQALASIISTKYAKGRTLDELRDTITELEESRLLQQALFDIAELTHTTPTLDDFYQRMHEIVGRLIPSDALFVCIMAADNSVLAFPYCYDATAGGYVDIEIPSERFASSLAAQLVLSGKARLLQQEEISELARTSLVLREGDIPFSWLGVPFVNEDVRGGIVVQNMQSSSAFSSTDLDLLTYAARQLSITITRRQKDAALRYQALHDELTGLPNRLLFGDRLEHALERYKRDRSRELAVMFLDLDRFKLINDAYGHSIGDQLLTEVSARIEKCLRGVDTLSRLGGDEFAILLEDVQTDGEMEALAQRIIEVVGEPVVLEGVVLNTSASVGIAKASDDCDVADELMKLADNAMYRAKARGKARFDFSGREDGTFINVLRIEQEIADALRREEFDLYLQPVLSLKTRVVQGFEALIRWKHPARGLVMPDSFIDVAEKSGQITEIDDYMLERAARVLSAWPQADEHAPYINVNLSGNSLSLPNLASSVSNLVQRHGLDPQRLAIEITERALIISIDQARENLQALKNYGCPIVLDDFGTGYSSLSYLQQLPIDVVKIDRSFVSTVQSSHTSHSVVKAIVSLAHTLEMQCLAEGIEQPEQEATLIELGVELAQGFRYFPPMPLAEAFHFAQR